MILPVAGSATAVPCRGWVTVTVPGMSVALSLSSGSNVTGVSSLVTTLSGLAAVGPGTEARVAAAGTTQASTNPATTTTNETTLHATSQSPLTSPCTSRRAPVAGFC